ncbi:Cu(I)-responsive transcriptional regulator [Erythrobacter sp. QSSC1-22B]|uniref:Cu(I)-responsive transcriptional regulator n=1 Tax=Erythrobacter sp. QSSC1-22B TaxID=1860125 RepID=UPI000805E7F8|nr:Cu(I)-responsive transcriptional regulator [Erythrobacter sp. QSSC1-22B]OBX18938.1 Cu(I)-responsive transcriptional regulator [Erythrobacter sp. QSSC1-22B]
MNIGEAGAASGVSAKMIRYYEKTGLIGAADRTDAGYRVYTNEDVHTLRFIRRARDLGFSVARINELLALWRCGDRSSAEVKTLTMAHVRELSKKVSQLQEMIATLTHLAENCFNDERPDCPILTGLAESSDRWKSGAAETRFGAARVTS